MFTFFLITSAQSEFVLAVQVDVGDEHAGEVLTVAPSELFS
jgi:hypothetical protein